MFRLSIFIFMNKRLTAIASYIKDGRGVIDVGTDHGYLPVYLAKSGYKGRILASDINAAPLSTALRTAERAEIKDKVELLLCDGLENCPPDAVDSIVIAGMGGDTICGILDRAEWCMDRAYTLILQPMTKAEILRYWLVNNEFEICAESLIQEGGSIYQLLVARFGGRTTLSDAELFTGRFTLIENDPLFEAQRMKLENRFEKALKGINGADSPVLSGKGALFRGILQGLKEMKRN